MPSIGNLTTSYSDITSLPIAEFVVTVSYCRLVDLIRLVSFYTGSRKQHVFESHVFVVH
jgi:hypothetical protein